MSVIAIEEQAELLALNGDVTEQQGGGAFHAHVVLGTRDATARGGHLIAARAPPTVRG
jgi:predicted DNA-binding protein with PD1-like motif